MALENKRHRIAWKLGKLIAIRLREFQVFPDDFVMLRFDRKILAVFCHFLAFVRWFNRQRRTKEQSRHQDLHTRSSYPGNPPDSGSRAHIAFDLANPCRLDSTTGHLQPGLIRSA
jgi:hypothetical protein